MVLSISRGVATDAGASVIAEASAAASLAAVSAGGTLQVMDILEQTKGGVTLSAGVVS